MKKFTFMLALVGAMFSSVQSAFATDEKWENKKITSVSAAVESLDALTDGYYVLRNVGRKTFVRENDNNSLYLWNATNGSDDLSAVQTAFVNSTTLLGSVVYVTKNTDSDYYTMQFKSGQYIGSTLPNGGAASSNATAGEVEISYVSDNQFNFRPTGSNWANGNGSGGYSEGTFTGWGTSAPGANGNGAYQFFPVTLEETQEIAVTWTVKAGDKTITTFTTMEEKESEITTVPSFESSYYFTDAQLVAPENNVVSPDNCNFTINVTEGTAPFEASTAANPTWYTVKFRNNDSKHLCHIIPTDSNIGSNKELTADYCNQFRKKTTFEGFLWAFVNDGLGVKILNKQTGKYVECAATNGAAATLGTTGTKFFVKTNTNGGFSLQIAGTTTAFIGDHASNRLGSWNTTAQDNQNDGGSNFGITLADEAIAVLKTVSTDSLNALTPIVETTMAAAGTEASINAAKAAVEAATTVAGVDAAMELVYIPVLDANAYYRIASVSSTNKYASSAPIFVGTDGKLATSYNANLSGDRVIRRVAEGSALVPQLWQFTANADGSYKIKNANTGLHMSPWVSGSPIDMPIAENNSGNFTLKANSSAAFTGDDCQTMMQMVLSGHLINAYGGNNNNIMQNWDDKTDKGCYWQIIKVTEIPVEISAANYASVGFPFAVQVPAESGVKAFYVASIANGMMGLKEFENGIIPANQGAILYHDGETSVNLAITTTDATVDNKLVAATAKRVGFDAESTYVLALNGEGNAAFLKSELTSVPANKAYVAAESVSTESSAAVLNFTFGGTTTGINGVEATDNSNVEYYDLNGRRVLYPSNGIFVTNAGKKVFIK